VFYAPHRGPEHANREPLVLQTGTALSIQRELPPASPGTAYLRTELKSGSTIGKWDVTSAKK